MAKIIIELHTGEDDQLLSQISSLFKGSSPKTVETLKTPEPTKAPVEANNPPTNINPKPSAPKATAPTPAPKAKAPEPTPEPEEEETQEDVTIEELRKLVLQKSKTNRDEIKGKLKELGAPNVSNLSPDHYNDLHEFLLELN